MRTFIRAGLALFLCLPLIAGDHPWPTGSDGTSLTDRIAPPPGYQRPTFPANSFAAWLRSLPLLPGQPRVLLFDGTPKKYQGAQFAVLDIDVGRRDLQQCADAVIRLRAEYLYALDPDAEIKFNFTSGDPARWRDWRTGMRPVIKGNKVSWQATGQPGNHYAAFRRYLNTVFAYAGTASLTRELSIVQPKEIQPGDVFIQPGYPGHAVLVADLAVNSDGEKVFLLVQSYMPAQQIHVLKNPAGNGPWYPVRDQGTLETPEWRFSYQKDLRRFKPRERQRQNDNG